MHIGCGEFWHGDCLDLMARIPDGSVDMVLCDLPYGTTACAWDAVIPFEPLWSHYRRVCKPGAAIVLTATQPFTSALIMSQPKAFKHNWYWNKRFGGNFVQAKNMPLRTIEDVLIFERDGKRANYNPQMIKREKPIIQGGRKKSQAIPIVGAAEKIDGQSEAKIYDEKFPIDLLEFEKPYRAGETAIHPTQKPVALFEYLIKTYTNPGALVLDNTAGSGTTAIAAERTGRDWLCIERDAKYYWAAMARIAKEVYN